MKKIKDYEIVKDFSSAGAGTSTWCIAEKDGKQYFIKQFLSPVLVSEESREKMPAAMVDAMQKACVLFVARKRRLYNTLNVIQMGNFVAPQDLLIYNGHYCAVSEAIETSVPAEDIHKLSEWHRIMLMRTMTLCLRTLASHHIAHSDIKLDNLMIIKNAQGNYNLKLLDFDSGFFEDDPPTNPNEMHGDMVYFAPEAMVFQQSEGESDIRLDCRIDQFALGLVLHQMWCGRLPDFNTEEYANAAEALLCGSSLQLDTAMPPMLRQAIGGLLQLQPENRMDYGQVYDLLGRELSHYEKPKAVTTTTAVVKTPSSEAARVARPPEPRKESVARVETPPVPAVPEKSGKGGKVFLWLTGCTFSGLGLLGAGEVIAMDGETGMSLLGIGGIFLFIALIVTLVTRD